MYVFDLIFLTGLFGLSDWLIGMDWKHVGWPTRSVYLIGPSLAVMMAAYGWVWHGHQWWQWALISIGWSLYRSVFGWSSFGGSMDVKTEQQFFDELERNLASIVFPLGTLFSLGHHPDNALLFVPLMLLFALGSTLIAVVYGYFNSKGKDIGPQTCIVRGILFGFLLWLTT